MIIRDNILTPEVRANGFGGIDPARFDEAVSQLALAAPLKLKSKAAESFDASFLPPASERKAN
jgi:NitT/TauT family transport system substrate-binding protein